MSREQEQWELLEEYFVVDELKELDGKAGWLSFDGLQAAIRSQDVNAVKRELYRLEAAEPVAGMSGREAITMLNVVKANASALIKSIDEVLCLAGTSQV